MTRACQDSNFALIFNNMGRKHHHHIPLFSTRATATFSVALVLVVLGVAAMVGIATRHITDSVRENLGFVVVLDGNATASDVATITERIKSHPAVNDCVYSSPETILARWQKIVGDDEDIMRLAQVNPFLPELEVTIRPSHACADSIALIAGPIGLLPQVNDIAVNNELLDGVNSTLSSVTFTLLLLGAGLLVVSFVLIFNTVRLAVYSRRFLIHTMKLVGATAGFIRRPFLAENVINGLVAGAIASILLALIVNYTRSLDASMDIVVTWTDTLAVMGAMILTGAVICFIAALFAANRYLRLSYDELFK